MVNLHVYVVMSYYKWIGYLELLGSVLLPDEAWQHNPLLDTPTGRHLHIRLESRHH